MITETEIADILLSFPIGINQGTELDERSAAKIAHRLRKHIETYAQRRYDAGFAHGRSVAAVDGPLSRNVA